LAIEGFGCSARPQLERSQAKMNEGYRKPGLRLPENSKRSADREPNVPLL